MPGKRNRFTEKEDRQIQHIKKSAMARGFSAKEASRIAYGTVVNFKKRKRKKSKSRKKG